MKIVLIGLIFGFSGVAIGSELPVTPATSRLLCSYQYSVGENGDRLNTTGEFTLTVMPQSDGTASIRKQDLGHLFVGKITEEQLTGQVNYQSGDFKISESLTVDRFTGEFRILLAFSGKPSLTHIGQCQPASPLF